MRWPFVVAVQLGDRRPAQWQELGGHTCQDDRQPREVEVGRGHGRMGAWPAVGGSDYVAVGNAVLAQVEEGMMPAGTRLAGKRPEDRMMEDKKWEDKGSVTPADIGKAAAADDPQVAR